MPILLDHQVAAHPHDVALVDGAVRRDWAQLADRVDAWCHVLKDAGLAVGDRIACVSENRAETFELILAALHTGLTLVPVNWHLTDSEIAYIITDSGSRGIVTDAARAPVAAAALRRAGTPVPLRIVTGDADLDGFTALEPRLMAAPAGPVAEQTCGTMMMYTSGTLGAPKGVLNGLFSTAAPYDRAQRLVAYARAVLSVPADGRVLLAGPWYHSAQLFFALLPLLAGSRLVVHRGFDPAAVLRVIDEQKITATHLVPTHFVRLLRLDEATRAAFRGDSLELVWHGGGPCSIAVKRAMIDWWGPVLLEYYGATEAGAATLITSAQWLARPGSVGRAVLPNEILVVDDEGRPVPPGTTGRVFVQRRNGRSFEYHNAPEKTRAAHLGDAFTFGEVGHLDAEGYLYLTGRAQDLIVSGGVNVYPAEVEAVLQDHPAVRDAAVLGVPDEEFGERVVAVLELAGAPAPPGVTAVSPDVAASLERHCRAVIAGFKVPRAWLTVPALPREATGKLRKGQMRELLVGLAAAPTTGQSAAPRSTPAQSVTVSSRLP
jgi:long-chain acyl-CoA synthetase